MLVKEFPEALESIEDIVITLGYPLSLDQNSTAENIECFGDMTETKKNTKTDQEISCLLASFHSTRKCYINSWGEKSPINVTSCRPCELQQ